jgi:hypothetical protein
VLRHTVRLAVLALVILGGLTHGQWSGRWSQSQALSDAVARLDRIPVSVGPWQSRPLEELERQAIEIGQIAGHTLRAYTDRGSGQEDSMLVVCGRPGPISVHTPDICFRGSGYEVTGAPVVERIALEPPARSSSFLTALFRKEVAGTPSTLRVFWAWNARGSWEAPENPRLQFASYRFLYKVYVVRQVPASEQSGEDPVCQRFLQQLLPQLDAALSTGR